MKRFENTFPLLLLSAALLCVSCSDDKERTKKEPPLQAVNYTIDFTTVTKAAYYGDKYETGTGCFALALSNPDGDVLEVELIASKAPKPSIALPETGKYTAAATHRSGTFTASASYWETSKAGEEVRSEQRPAEKKRFAIGSGSLTLALAEAADGTYTLTGAVTDGNITHLAFTWSGPLTFVNESGESDPIEYQTLSMVYGDYYANDYGIAANTYMLSGGNERFELGSQLRSASPSDPAAPRPNAGEYTIDMRSAEGKYANEEFTFRSGYFSSSGRASGTWWKDGETTHVATSGSFTVTDEGGQWSIRGVLRDDEGAEFAFTFTGTPNFRQ